MPPFISFAATNPCHVYDMAVALHRKGALGSFICGYPPWKLKPPAGFPYRQAGWRTLATYGLLRLPRSMRPGDPRLFRWQDMGFDRAAVSLLPREKGAVLHGIPGQCLATFRAARERGLITVLNHASGPLRQQVALVRPEYERAGVPFAQSELYPEFWLQRIAEETRLADFHCVASTIVRDQLMAEGVPSEAIFVVPYGAHPGVFVKRRDTPKGRFRILFAGQLSLRKGVHYLLQALEASGAPSWTLDCFGLNSPETENDFDHYRGAPTVCRHGSISQSALAREMANASVLVLPSAEEAFGLVVSQALQVGLPCIVSDRVGAKDLIRPGVNGSIVPFGNPAALADALTFWASKPTTVPEPCDWEPAAKIMIEQTERLALASAGANR